MNTEKQLPSGIESEVKYTLQFLAAGVTLGHDGKRRAL